MPSLEQITQSGMFSVDNSSKLSPSLISLGEELLAEEFAANINSERLSVEDVWTNYWSYKEDSRLWNLQKDIEWRAVLPEYKGIIKSVLSCINPSLMENLIKNLIQNYQKASEEREGLYNPFIDDLIFSSALVSLPTISDAIRLTVTGILIENLQNLGSTEKFNGGYFDSYANHMKRKLFYALHAVNHPVADKYLSNCGIPDIDFVMMMNDRPIEGAASLLTKKIVDGDIYFKIPRGDNLVDLTVELVHKLKMEKEIEELITSPKWFVRYAASEILCTLKSPLLTKYITKLLCDPASEVGLNLAYNLSPENGAELSEEVCKILYSKNENDVVNAITAIQKLLYKPAIPRLIELVKKGSALVSNCSIKALLDMKATELKDLLIEKFYKNPNGQGNELEALAELGCKESVELYLNSSYEQCNYGISLNTLIKKSGYKMTIEKVKSFSNSPKSQAQAAIFYFAQNPKEWNEVISICKWKNFEFESTLISGLLDISEWSDISSAVPYLINVLMYKTGEDYQKQAVCDHARWALFRSKYVPSVSEAFLLFNSNSKYAKSFALTLLEKNYDDNFAKLIMDSFSTQESWIQEQITNTFKKIKHLPASTFLVSQIGKVESYVDCDISQALGQTATPESLAKYIILNGLRVDGLGGVTINQMHISTKPQGYIAPHLCITK